MNGLYPIIRRKRRPLVVEETPLTVGANVEPVQANAERGTGNAENFHAKGEIVETAVKETSGTWPKAQRMEHDA